MHHGLDERRPPGGIRPLSIMFAPSSPAVEQRLDERRPPGGSSRRGQPLPPLSPSRVKRVVSLGQTDVPDRSLLRGKVHAVRRRRARPPGKRRDPIVARVQLYTIATQNSPINTREDWDESAHHRSLSTPSLLSFPVRRAKRFLPRVRAVVLPTRLRPCTRSRRRRRPRPRTTRPPRPAAPRPPSRCRRRLPSPPGPPGSATASTTAATVSAPSLPFSFALPSCWLLVDSSRRPCCPNLTRSLLLQAA
jgi:hypothetical protein